MADPTTAALAAMFGGLNGGATTGSDLDQFQRTIAGNDLYKIGAAPILGAKFDTSTWSPGTTAAVTAGQAFLGALLNRYGQIQEANQMNAVSQILPQLYSNPASVAVPEGVDESAFETLRANQVKNKLIGEATAGQKIKDLFTAAQIGGYQKKLETQGEIAGKQEAYKDLGVTDPENPIEKKVVELRDKYNQLDEIKDYKYVSRLSDQLVRVLQDPSSVSDQALAKMAVQFIEAHLSTTSGETAALAGSGSIPEGWKADISKSMNGGTALPAEVRSGLLRLASASLTAHGNAYKKAYDQGVNEAKLYGIDPTRVFSMGPPVSFEQLTGKNVPLPNIKLFADDAKARGLSKEQAQAEWLKLGGTL